METHAFHSFSAVGAAKTGKNRNIGNQIVTVANVKNKF